tara:strand:- start:104 stop:310 length:207 start_codon:yes stop_codon:yes gene_type:complete
VRSEVQIFPDPPLFLILAFKAGSLPSGNFADLKNQPEKKPLIQGLSGNPEATPDELSKAGKATLRRIF